jgi:hypothetical protein
MDWDEKQPQMLRCAQHDSAFAFDGSTSPANRKLLLHGGVGSGLATIQMLGSLSGTLLKIARNLTSPNTG